MFEEYKNLWVYIESSNGVAANVGLELLNPTRALADSVGEKLVAIVIDGKGTEAIAQTAIRYGADEVIVVEGEEYASYSTDAYTNVLNILTEKYKPSALFIGATNRGRDLGPRLAARVKTGLTADCTSLAMDNGNIVWTRPAFGGNLMANILCPEHRPQLGTVRPGVFKKIEPDESRKGNIIKEDIRTPLEMIRTKIVDIVTTVGSDVPNIEDAEILVSGGAGVGGPEGYGVLKELALAMGGSIAASRAAVDAGWIDHAYQVGQTGKTVGPKIYIACGISGAIQHVAGMSSADVIIAINKDPEANIFKVADYGIVGDLFEVVPILTEEIKKRK